MSELMTIGEIAIIAYAIGIAVGIGIGYIFWK